MALAALLRAAEAGVFVDKARVQTGGGLREDFDDARVREGHEAAGASGASPTRKKPYFKRCASDSERERHCARFLRKFRENTVAPYLPYGSRL